MKTIGKFLFRNSLNSIPFTATTSSHEQPKGQSGSVKARIISTKINGDFGSYLGLIAVVFATVNVVGGFMVTDRMLKMFKRK